MTLITFQREAPVAPDATACRLCDACIGGTLQDHLLLGQPGTDQQVVAICPACGDRLSRLVDACGRNLSVLEQSRRLGIALMLVVIVHLLTQWDWTISCSRSFLSRLTQRVRFTYALNWALFISVVLVFFSGLVISENALPSLGLSIGQRGTPMVGFCHQLHILTADAVLVLAAIHLGLNRRWVVSTLQQVLHIGGRKRGTQTGRRSGAQA